VSSTHPDYAVPPVVLLREVDGEMVLLNIATEQYYGLDPVGAAMVTELLARPREGAVEALLARYSVGRERLVADLDALVARLTATGLLVLSGSA
jgi:hypothetical protein